MTSALETELRHQGSALAAREQQGWSDAAEASRLLRADDIDYLLIAARGSSDNAARYGQYLFGLEAGLSVALAAPWLFGHGHDPPRLGRAAVLAISQSGQSPDVAAVVAAARRQRRPTIALTNFPDSPVARRADVVVDLGVGPERSVAATKTYLASLHALVQIAARLRPRREWEQWLGRLPELVSEAVETELDHRGRFDGLNDLALLTMLGRGLDFAAAFETALKVRELSGKPAEAFSPPDLMHGPVAAIDRRTALWVVSGARDTDPELLRLVGRRLRPRAGLAIAVSPDPRLLTLTDITVPLPKELPGWAAAIAAVIPGQIAALRLAELGGVEIDTPHGLRKVTMTR